jgi:hypothetical protein
VAKDLVLDLNKLRMVSLVEELSGVKINMSLRVWKIDEVGLSHKGHCGRSRGGAG